MKSTLRFVTYRFLSLLFIYFLIRIFYQTYNFADFSSVPVRDLLTAYLSGLRFDISAILKLNAIFFIIWLLPLKVIHSGLFSKVISSLYLILNILFIFAGAADAELIHFSGQRLTFNYFAMSQDIENQMGQILRYYWKPFFVTTCISILFVKLQVQSPKDFKPIKASPIRAIAAFLLIFFIGLGVRGGFQNKPLRTAHAFSYSRAELGQLALNSTFTLLQSGGKSSQQKINFVPESEINQLVKRDRTPHFKNFWQKKQNIVIIIVESLALEYVGAANNGRGYTPFLDSLSEKGLLFTNAFANGRRSLEAVPSVLASLPSLLNDPFLTSNYQGSKILGLGQTLEQAGYATSFFHGAVNGSMFFDSFSARAGFKNYYGLSEYPEKKRDYDGFWGILDEPFLQYFASNLDQMPEPFASVFFTLSSHQPYPVPEKYKGKFPKGTLEIHESLGYTDYALRQFFEDSKSKNWFNDTLFIITGDHTQKSDVPSYQNELGNYRVPIILYHPGLTSTAQWPSHDLARPIQHADIMPTVLDVLNLPQESLSQIGTSVFSNPEDAFVINKTPNGYWYLSPHNFIKIDLNQKIDVSNFNSASSASSNENSEVLKMKAFLQYFVNGIIENKLFK